MIKLKLGQILKHKTSDDNFIVEIIAEGGANLSGGWFTDKEIEEKFILPKEKWVPEYKEGYYYIDNDAIVNSTYNANNHLDLKRIDIGNCFQTEAEALIASDKIKELLKNL